MKLFTDEHNQHFTILRNKAMYITGQLCTIPGKYTEASSQSKQKHEYRLTLMWKLVQKNIGLIFHIAAKMNISKDIAYDLGMDALIRCTTKFDPLRGYKFSTYVGRAIRNAFLDYEPRNTVELPDDLTIEQTDEIDVQYAINKLSKYDKTLIILRFWKGMTYQELADTTGTVKSTIHLHIKEALHRLKCILEKQ